MGGLLRSRWFYAFFYILLILAPIIGGQFRGLSPGVASSSSTSNPPPVYFTVSVVPVLVVVEQAASVQARIILTGVDVTALNPCSNGTWYGNLRISAIVSPSVTMGPTVSVTPSCLTLASGQTKNATLAVSTTGLTRLGTYIINVDAGWTVSPSGWVSESGTSVQVTVVPDDVTAALDGYSILAAIVLMSTGAVGIVLTRRAGKLSSLGSALL